MLAQLSTMMELPQLCSSLNDSENNNAKPAPLTFEELYNKYYKWIYNICLRKMSNTADAEDLAHDAIMQAQRKLASYRGDSALSSWIYRVTINQIFMHFRKKSNKVETITDYGIMPENPDLIVNTNSSATIFDHVLIAEAVEQLPPGYRNVFILHDVEGYEHREIAEILGINIGTSKSQLHKARLRLRELILEKA